MNIISKEVIDDCKEKFKFSYDSEKVKKVIDDVAIEVGKHNTIKGFRKGKAPLEAIKQQLKKYIMDIAKQKLTSEAFEDILYETKNKPFGQPSIDDVIFNSKNFNIDMTVNFIPKFDLNKYKDFDLEEMPDKVNVSDFKEKMKEGICQEFGTLSSLEEDDFVLLGDEVCIDYIGKIDNEDFEKNTGKDIKFVVGQNQAIKELEDDIIGMSVGESRDITIKFPEDFKEEKLKGKEAVFNVTLKSARRKESSEFNEELVKKAGFKSMEDFDKVIEMKANEKIAEFEFLYYRNKINELLIENNKIEVPLWMKTEIAKNYVKAQNKKWEDITDEEQAEAIKEASKRLSLSFLLDKIKETEIETAMTDEEIISSINSNLYRFPKEIQEQLIKGKNPKLLTQIASEIQDEYLMKWIINQSNKIKGNEDERIEV